MLERDGHYRSPGGFATGFLPNPARRKEETEMSRRPSSVIAILVGSLFASSVAYAQLTDETQTTPNVPGGAIAKSLEEQVGVGHGDEFTYGSAVYLIKRDPARSIRRGSWSSTASVRTC